MFQPQKSRKFSNIGIGLLIALTAFFAFGQTPVATDIRPLPLNKTVEREIKAAEEHFYTIKLKQGEALRLELQEGQDVNYVFRLLKADDGQTITEADLTTTFGREAITYIAAAKENLKVLVKAPEKINNSAAYKLTGTVAKRATELDKERIKAEELSREASKLSKDAVNLPEGNGTESYRKATELAEEALKLRRKQADKYWEGWTLNFLGNLSNRLGDNQKAIDYYNQTLQVIKPDNKKIVEVSILLNNAGIYERLNEPTKAIDNYNQALEIFRVLKDRTREEYTLSRFGDLYLQLGRYEKAIDYYEQLIALARENKDRLNEVMYLNTLGFIYRFRTQQFEKALQIYQQQLIIFQELKNHDSEFNTLISIGSIYSSELYQPEKAREIYEQALEMRRRTKDRKGESYILFVLGNLYDVSDPVKAIQYYEQALKILEEINDRNGQSGTLSIIGMSYLQLKKYNKALQYSEKSLLIAQESKNLVQQRIVLSRIGSLYLDLKNYEKALEYYEKAASIVLQSDTAKSNRSFIDEIHLAGIYFKLGQYEKSKKFYEKMFDYSQEEVAIFGLIGIANIYKEQKQYDKAREYFEKELAYYKEKHRKLEYAALNNLGILYQEQKQYEKARAYYEQSLTSLSESQIQEKLATIYLLGELYLDQKQYEKAREYFEQGLAKVREHNLEKKISTGTLAALVDLYQGLNNPELAIFYGKQEVNLYQNVRIEIKSFDRNTQLSFVKDKEPAYRKLADLLISEGRLPEAQTVLDLLKEEEFRNFTVRRSGEIPDTVPYSKAESDVAAKVENLAKAERELAELLKLKEQGALPPDKQSRLDQIPSEIEAANRAFRIALDSLGKSESSVESKVAEIKSEQNLQRALAQLQKETGSSVVALYTVLGTEDVSGGENTDGRAKTKFGWIILVTPNLRKAYPIDVAELEQIVFQFRETLQSDKYDPQPLAEKLYQKLFRQTSAKQKVTLEADLEDLLGNNKDKTLMWSLDGILRYVPMAALHDGNGYLVEKYRNVVFTKESFLTLTEKDKSKWQALGLGVSEGGKNYAPLPGAEKELRDIVREPQAKTGILDGVIRLNKDFAEEATLKLWREGKYPVIHIASHYAFNPTDPTSSFLLVGDGLLTFAEMQDKDNLFGTVDLLTLSACDTAMVNNGKEAEGFAYLAQNLGAKSVIASLWKVSDEGTPELMIRFYKLRAENPQMAKGEAFRLAQISLLAGESKTKETSAKRSNLLDLKREKSGLRLFVKDEAKPLAHPHYWSSFVLIGNWR